MARAPTPQRAHAPSLPGARDGTRSRGTSADGNGPPTEPGRRVSRCRGGAGPSRCKLRPVRDPGIGYGAVDERRIVRSDGAYRGSRSGRTSTSARTGTTRRRAPRSRSATRVRRAGPRSRQARGRRAGPGRDPQAIAAEVARPDAVLRPGRARRERRTPTDRATGDAHGHRGAAAGGFTLTPPITAAAKGADGPACLPAAGGAYGHDWQLPCRHRLPRGQRLSPRARRSSRCRRALHNVGWNCFGWRLWVGGTQLVLLRASVGVLADRVDGGRAVRAMPSASSATRACRGHRRTCTSRFTRGQGPFRPMITSGLQGHRTRSPPSRGAAARRGHAVRSTDISSAWVSTPRRFRRRERRALDRARRPRRPGSDGRQSSRNISTMTCRQPSPCSRRGAHPVARGSGRTPSTRSWRGTRSQPRPGAARPARKRRAPAHAHRQASQRARTDDQAPAAHPAIPLEAVAMSHGPAAPCASRRSQLRAVHVLRHGPYGPGQPVAEIRAAAPRAPAAR
jgi:hypothetical protein